MSTLLQTSLGEIVATYPLTIQVMNTFKLDYCCGGKDTLEKAILEAKLNDKDVVVALTEAIDRQVSEGKTVKNWMDESYSSLIEYILAKHHSFMKNTLDEINPLMYKILKVHFDTNWESLLPLHKLFGTLKTELEAHLIKEEENLFPLLLDYESYPSESKKESILEYIASTEHEHDDAGDLFKQIAEITNDYSAPLDACFSYRRTYELLNALEKDTFNHIHLENSILFAKLTK